MMLKHIPILMAADDNYVKYLYVAILSMLKNRADDTYYEFFILSPKSYPESILNDFDCLTKKFGNMKVNYVHMGNQFDNVEDIDRLLPSATYYHLAIADIIKDYKRAIYLDPDIIVLGDLTDLFETEMGDSYVAGVKAAGYMIQPQTKQYTDFGLPEVTQYINANSLVWNLDLVRKDKVTEKFYKYSKNIYPSQDQDVLNIVCYNKITHIPFKYNLMVKYLPPKNHPIYSYDFLQSVYGADNIKDALNNPVVIHYANVNEKPWHTRVHLDKYWWRYARKTPYYKEFLIDYIKHNYIKNFKIRLKKFVKSVFSISNQKYGQNRYKLLTIFGCVFRLIKQGAK